MKSGNLNFLEPFGPLQACNGIALPFTLQVDIAGLGLRRVRIANLPPELPDRILRETISKYGTVKGISEESWSKAYRYPVSNGIRIVELNLNLHKPSHMVIAGIRVLISYEGQPLTCYSCNGAGHQYNECPPKDENWPPSTPSKVNSWAQIVTQGTAKTSTDEVTQAVNNEEDATNTENINTIHTPTQTEGNMHRQG